MGPGSEPAPRYARDTYQECHRIVTRIEVSPPALIRKDLGFWGRLRRRGNKALAQGIVRPSRLTSRADNRIASASIVSVHAAFLTTNADKLSVRSANFRVRSAIGSVHADD